MKNPLHAPQKDKDPDFCPTEILSEEYPHGKNLYIIVRITFSPVFSAREMRKLF
jgi:hypothetical protein